MRRIATLPDERSLKRSNTTLKTHHTENVEETINNENRRKPRHFTMPVTQFSQKNKDLMENDEKF